MERISSSRELAAIFDDILAVEPKPVQNFVPIDAAEQKAAFLNNEQDNPQHEYDRLSAMDFEAQRAEILKLTAEAQSSPEISSKFSSAYAEFLHKHLRKLDMMQAAEQLANATTDEERLRLETEFMEANVELYGEPEKNVYRALLSEVQATVLAKSLPAKSENIRTELLTLLPEIEAGAGRYKPAIDTVRKVQELAGHLYGGLLEHVPETVEKLSPDQIRDVFEEIINDEFGESAEGWKVIVTKAASINVVASEKTIKIPENRAPIGATELKGLVAHELGVHFLRSITGSETDLLPLQTGLADYYDAEEGLGKVMEQAVNGKYQDSGIPYYLVAGMMYHDGLDFRAAHEIMWRYNAIKSQKADKEIDSESIEKARDAAYKTVFRVTRGTDTLPWFKDLAYYNGAESMWKHMETVSDDAELFQFVTLGKGDPTNKDHERLMYETRSV